MSCSKCVQLGSVLASFAMMHAQSNYWEKKIAWMNRILCVYSWRKKISIRSQTMRTMFNKNRSIPPFEANWRRRNSQLFFCYAFPALFFAGQIPLQYHWVYATFSSNWIEASKVFCHSKNDSDKVSELHLCNRCIQFHFILYRNFINSMMEFLTSTCHVCEIDGYTGLWL